MDISPSTGGGEGSPSTRVGRTLEKWNPMAILAIIALSMAPGIFWLWFFYKRDRLEPEPRIFVILVFLLGMLSAVPAFVLELPFQGFTFLSLVIVAPVVEEVLKFLSVRFTIYMHDEFDEPMDGIVYGAAAALGFASAENPLYLINTYMSAGGEAAAAFSVQVWGEVGKVFVIRALLAVPGHALWSSMWGFALGRAKFMGKAKWPKVKIIFIGLSLAILFHGLHNFLSAFISEFAPVAVLFLALFIWGIVWRNINTALSDSPFAPSAMPIPLVAREPGE